MQMYGKDFGIPNIKQYLTVCSIPSLSLLLLHPPYNPPFPHHKTIDISRSINTRMYSKTLLSIKKKL